jgi:chromosome partitioning protein
LKIISIANQKGGSGKTTLAVNISAILAMKNRRTLLIDLDPQSNSTMSLIEPRKINSKNSVGALLCDEVKIAESIHSSGYLPKLDFIPATLDLSITELDLSHQSTGGVLLKERLEELDENQYDYVICDCPPNFGVMTTNAVYASSLLLVPMEPETFAFYGLEMFMTSLVPKMRKYVNKKFKLLGIVLNRVNTTRILTQTIRKELQRRYREFLFRTEIPIDVRLPESASAHLPICIYARSSRSAQALDLLTDEFIERIGKIEQR